ncbi:hypothetical protein AVEN_162451-1 [Araneus ventricosus]|uniref:Uncharacterized protein n=1 Tax=Araneus ventricosus TaxID=182803 RepID=A0A4Y2MUD6_ARAVE|nr:hypothetical protein AVEN_162451-1 [Araneus ventricosus]
MNQLLYFSGPAYTDIERAGERFITKFPHWLFAEASMNQPLYFSGPAYTDIERAGERFIIALYSNTKKEESSLNKMRDDCFNKLIGQASSAILLPKLPPTTEAAHQHCRRTFHQVQT